MIPDIVAYLASLRRPTGGQLLQYNVAQATIPYFPANSYVAYDIVPLPGTLGAIGFKWEVFVPPGVFDVEIQLWGAPAFAGRIYEPSLIFPSSACFIYTPDNPVKYRLVNIAAIPHFWVQNVSFLAILNEEDFITVYQKISEYGGEQAGELLTQIEKALREIPRQAMSIR